VNTFEAIEQRRSVKQYDPDHHFSEEEIDGLLSAAMLSPTSFNIQNWRFVLVTDIVTRKELRKAAWDQAQVTDASVLLVLCADLKAWQRQPERYWKNAPAETREQLVPMIGDFYSGNDQLQRDEAMRSVGLAAQTIMLAAKDMGYDSCPMIGFDPALVAKAINLPEDHIIGMMLAVGKSIRGALERGGQLPKDEVVIQDQFPT
jgi:nitroreductase